MLSRPALVLALVCVPPRRNFASEMRHSGASSRMLAWMAGGSALLPAVVFPEFVELEREF